MKKLKPVDGWIENDGQKSKTGIPDKCPKCGSPLWKVNALSTCGVILVGCKNLKCRWAEEYTE